MAEDQGGDATRMSSRAADDATLLGSRATDGATRLSERATDDATLLGSRATDDSTRLSSRAADDATWLSSRAQGEVQTTLSPTGLGLGAQASEIGTSGVTLAYDPGSEGIVLTKYEPNVLRGSSVASPSVAITPGWEAAPDVDYAALETQRKTERDYERSTTRLMGVVAAGGLLLLGASATLMVVLLQGF